MSDIEIAIRLAVVAVLVSYLYLKHRRREREHRRRECDWSEQYDPEPWTGQAIDVSELKPRVEQVRRDYLRARPPAKGLCAHRALLALARRVVVRLAYFQQRTR